MSARNVTPPSPEMRAEVMKIATALMTDQRFTHALDALAMDVAEVLSQFIHDQGDAVAKHLPDASKSDYLLALLVGWCLGADSDGYAVPGRLTRLQLRLVAAAFAAGFANGAFAEQRSREVH